MSSFDEEDAAANFGEDFVPRRHPEVTSVELDGEAVLYRAGTMHRLDPIATLLWNAFDGSTTLGELADDLAVVYEESPTKIFGDLVACVRDLAVQGLLAVDI